MKKTKGGAGMAKKYEYVAQVLREELSGGTYARIPSEAALGERFHCSRQTIRRALGILVAEGVIWRRQGSGSFLSPQGAGTEMVIAVLTPSPESYLFPRQLHDMKQVLTQRGFTLEVFPTQDSILREREILTALGSSAVRGLLVQGVRTGLPNPNLPLYRALQARDIPTVFLGFGYPELTDTPAICDDSRGGGQMLARHLLRRGCKKIGGIFPFDDRAGQERYRGVLWTLEGGDDRNFCWYGTGDRQRLLEGDGALLRFFLEGPLSQCDGLICHNDEIAYHIIKLLLSMGKKVPEDVAVVAFENGYYSQISPVSITTLQHSGQREGTVAANQLLSLLHGNRASSQKLSWSLLPRASG